MTESEEMIIKFMRIHIQYSDRLALPRKSAYFLITAEYLFMVPSAFKANTKNKECKVKRSGR